MRIEINSEVDKWWRNEQLSGWNLKRDSWFSFRGWKSYLAHREWNGSQLWQQVWSKFKQHITFTSVTIPSLFLSKAFMKKSDDLSILMKLSLVKFPSSPARRITLCAGVIKMSFDDDLDQNVVWLVLVRRLMNRYTLMHLCYRYLSPCHPFLERG